MKMKEKTKDYLKGIVCTGSLIIGKINKDGDIEKPYTVMVTTGNEKDREGKALPSGMIALAPFLPEGFGPLKRNSIISETLEIEEGILKTYQNLTSKIAAPTLQDISNINKSKININ